MHGLGRYATAFTAKLDFALKWPFEIETASDLGKNPNATQHHSRAIRMQRIDASKRLLQTKTRRGHNRPRRLDYRPPV